MKKDKDLKRQIIDIIYFAIDEISSTYPGISLKKDPSTALYGPAGGIDSIALVNLIVITEQEVSYTFNCVLIISDDRAMSQKHSPFATIDSLADYIISILP
jgi:D-alanine--poly(phosphoribitol) ligase subunit 2